MPDFLTAFTRQSTQTSTSLFASVGLPSKRVQLLGLGMIMGLHIGLQASGSAIALPADRPTHTMAETTQAQTAQALTLHAQATPAEAVQSQGTPDQAAPQATIPPAALTTMVAAIDQAASQEDLAAVMAFYSPDLDHGDGLSYEEIETMLSDFWETQTNLQYSTTIQSWEQTEAGFLTTTVTTIVGEQPFGDAMITLTASLESQQTIQNNQIVKQEILAEQSQIQLGDNPPTVEVQVPEVIAIGQPFFFDAIVLEPIGNSLLMGAAFSEEVSLESYTATPSLRLDVLGAGGLFKMGNAAITPDQQWVSGLLIREDGITGVTQRLRTVNVSDLSSGL